MKKQTSLSRLAVLFAALLYLAQVRASVSENPSSPQDLKCPVELVLVAINGSDEVPLWALTGAETIAAATLSDLGGLATPRSAQIEIYPSQVDNTEIGRAGGYCFQTGHGCVVISTSMITFTLDRKPTSAALAHELGHVVATMTLYRDLRREIDIMKDASLVFWPTPKERARVAKGKWFGRFKPSQFQRYFHLFGLFESEQVRPNMSRVDRYLLAYTHSKTVRPYQELFSDVFAVLHTGDADSIAQDISGDVPVSHPLYQQIRANRSFVRPTVVPGLSAGPHEFFREVRWHLGDRHLPRAFAEPAYASRLREATYTAMKNAAIRHYRRRQFDPTPIRGELNRQFAASIDELMATDTAAQNR